MASSETKKQKFITLLHELFQLNQPELDFGIYGVARRNCQGSE